MEEIVAKAAGMPDRDGPEDLGQRGALAFSLRDAFTGGVLQHGHMLNEIANHLQRLSRCAVNV
jgi:hypothetical protein